MKKTILVAAVAGLMLSACASHHPPHARMIKPDPHNPNVYVVDDKYIVVNQEPIYIRKDDKKAIIIWQLPKDSQYSFPEDGIVIAKPDREFECNLEGDKQRFRCKFENSKPGRYKYTIKVIGGAGPIKPLDPYIVND